MSLTLRITTNFVTALAMLAIIANVITGDYTGAVGFAFLVGSMLVIEAKPVLSVSLDAVACLMLAISCYLEGSVMYIVFLVLAILSAISAFKAIKNK